MEVFKIVFTKLSSKFAIDLRDYKRSLTCLKGLIGLVEILIAIAILDFSLLLPLLLSFFQLCDSKVVALNPFASIFV